MLLKPGSDRRAHVVVRGRPAGTLEAGEYATGRAHLAEAAYAAYDELAGRFEMVICEGAGSPAEINLREGDYVNAGLARRFGLPMVVVGDIDRGGVFAALYGTYALLEEADRKLITCFVINKFRGDLGVLAPGLDELTRRTGIPVAGVLPWLEGIWLDGEDTLEVGAWGRSGRQAAPAELTVAVVRLPRVSNLTDVDAAGRRAGSGRPGHHRPRLLADADLVVLPGSRSTVADLAWLRDQRTGSGAARSGAPRGRGAGDLRRLPDAGHDDLRRAGVRLRAQPGPGPAADQGRFRRRQAAGPAARDLARASGAGVRDPPRGGRAGR